MVADGEKGSMAAMFGKPSLAIYSQIGQKVVPNNSFFSTYRSSGISFSLRPSQRSKLKRYSLLIFISSRTLSEAAGSMYLGSNAAVATLRRKTSSFEMKISIFLRRSSQGCRAPGRIGADCP